MRARADNAFARYALHLGGVLNRSEYTLRNYQSDLGAFFAYLASRGVEFDRAGRGHARGFLAQQHEAEVAPASVRRQATTVKAFYRWLDHEGMLPPATPGDSILMLRYPKVPKLLPQVLSIDEAEALVDAPDTGTPRGLRDHAMLELLWGAGLRVSELVGVDGRDLDLTNRQVRVTGKGDKTRIAIFGEPAAAALRDYIALARPALATGAEPSLFLGREGHRISVRTVQDIVHRMGVQAALGRAVHPHVLRHTFATHMIEGNADLRVVQELLGHASADTTQIYTTVTKRRQETIVTAALGHAREVEQVERPRSGTGA